MGDALAARREVRGPYLRGMRIPLALALAGTALLATACSTGTSASSDPATSAPGAAESSAAAPASPEATASAEASTAPSTSAPSTSAPEKPSAADMATDRLADAVLEQLKIDSPDTFTDQLVTIALSPLMRQLASTADVTTRVATKGPKVTLTLTGDDGTCVITVSDEPRARGVVCKAA